MSFSVCVNSIRCCPKLTIANIRGECVVDILLNFTFRLVEVFHVVKQILALWEFVN